MVQGERAIKRVLVFGNPYEKSDNAALEVARALEDLDDVDFTYLDGVDGLEEHGAHVRIMDCVHGLREPAVFSDLKQFARTQSTTAHDFDLSIYLWILQQTGRLKSVTVVGVPETVTARDVQKTRALLQKI